MPGGGGYRSVAGSKNPSSDADSILRFGLHAWLLGSDLMRFGIERRMLGHFAGMCKQFGLIGHPANCLAEL
jgi:hypothetical protein